MKNFFLAYRATGIDSKTLMGQLRDYKDALSSHNQTVHITDLDEGSDGHSLSSAYDKIIHRDGLIVIMASADKSEGMLVEVGFAYRKVPIYLFKKQGVITRVDGLATTVIEWIDHDDLLQKLKNGVEYASS